MIASANPLRVALCRSHGAEIVFAPDAHAGFAMVERIAAEEGRTFIHPFEGRTTALGTATLGLELCEQLPGLQAVIVPIGGGGLCAGVASAVKLLAPQCEVIGVEPFGADSMYRSFAAGEPRSIERVATIADSLGAPYALPISFEYCRRNVDELVRVSDDELRSAMRFLLRNAKLAVEPAGAATTAALLGPARERLRGKRVAAIVCGSNIDEATYAKLIAVDGAGASMAEARPIRKRPARVAPSAALRNIPRDCVRRASRRTARDRLLRAARACSRSAAWACTSRRRSTR